MVFDREDYAFDCSNKLRRYQKVYKVRRYVQISAWYPKSSKTNSIVRISFNRHESEKSGMVPDREADMFNLKTMWMSCWHIAVSSTMIQQTTPTTKGR